MNTYTIFYRKRNDKTANVTNTTLDADSRKEALKDARLDLQPQYVIVGCKREYN